MKNIHILFIACFLVLSASSHALIHDSEQQCINNATKDYQQWFVQSDLAHISKKDKAKLKSNIDSAYSGLNELFAEKDYSQCPAELETKKQTLYMLTEDYIELGLVIEELARSADENLDEDKTLSFEEKKAIQANYIAAIQSQSVLFKDIWLQINHYEVYLENLGLHQ